MNVQEFERPILICAHPDDEVISSSKYISSSRDRIHIAYVTDGDADEEGGKKRKERSQESRTALEYAGIEDRNQIHFLGFPESDTPNESRTILHRIKQLIERLDPDLILTHAYDGAHFDHDLVRFLINILISSESLDIPIAEFALYHDNNGHSNHNTFITPDSTRDIVFNLSAEDITRKERMLSAYRSQQKYLKYFNTGNPELMRFCFANELDPRIFEKKPHSFLLGYDDLKQKNRALFEQITLGFLNKYA